MAGLSETLAGRIALFELLPFSFEELGEKPKLPLDCYRQMLKGFYPFVNTNEVNIDRFYSSYLTTYIERDIRQIQNVKDLGLFQTFMQLLAARAGSLLNISELAKECAISNETAKNWLSILETSRIVYLLRPYFRNITKRAVKSPKIYFTDCGLLAHLLKYKSADTLLASSISGHIFENMIIMEILKKNFNLQKGAELYFFRDNNKSEIDLIIDEGHSFSLFEIKSGKTIAMDAVKNLQKIDLPNSQKFVLSFLENRLAINQDTLSIPWRECDKL
jgi:predicted AAA+ superfamily ATPase